MGGGLRAMAETGTHTTCPHPRGQPLVPLRPLSHTRSHSDMPTPWGKCDIHTCALRLFKTHLRPSHTPRQTCTHTHTHTHTHSLTQVHGWSGCTWLVPALLLTGCVNTGLSFSCLTSDLDFILAWRPPWTEEPGGLQSVGLQTVWTRQSD